MAAYLLATPGYSDMPAAQAFYSSVANGTTFVTAPIRAFSHNSADPGFQNQAITAGEAIYTGNVYPASLQNNFFFTNFTDRPDLCHQRQQQRRCEVSLLGQAGLPRPTSCRDPTASSTMRTL